MTMYYAIVTFGSCDLSQTTSTSIDRAMKVARKAKSSNRLATVRVVGPFTNRKSARAADISDSHPIITSY